ncbi:MAG: hypothetical protein WA081_03760, partial [Desulfosalsimonadaceae bacterium]
LIHAAHLCLKKPNKMIERSESSLNNPENNCHSQNNQKNQLHFFWKSTAVVNFTNQEEIS